MSNIIQQYLDDCRDPVLTPEAKARLIGAFVPKSVESDTTMNPLVSSSNDESDPIPTVEVDRSVINQILSELEQAGARPETLTLLKFLIQTEVYYELQLSNDEQVIMALKYLESQGYNASIVENCIQILETPSDSEIPHPGAFVELLSESLKINKYETLAIAVMNYLEQCMAD